MLAMNITFFVHAQEMEPRSYSVVPVGLHAAQLSYTFSGGDVVSGLEFTIAEPKYQRVNYWSRICTDFFAVP